MPVTRDKADHERLYSNRLAEAARAGRDAGRYTAARGASPGIRACRRVNPARGAAARLRHVIADTLTGASGGPPAHHKAKQLSSLLFRGSFALKALWGS